LNSTGNGDTTLNAEEAMRHKENSATQKLMRKERTQLITVKRIYILDGRDATGIPLEIQVNTILRLLKLNVSLLVVGIERDISERPRIAQDWKLQMENAIILEIPPLVI